MSYQGQVHERGCLQKLEKEKTAKRFGISFSYSFTKVGYVFVTDGFIGTFIVG